MKRHCSSNANVILTNKAHHKTTCTKPDQAENKIYKDFIDPYKNIGINGLPSMDVFMQICRILNKKYDKTKCIKYKIYDELLTIVFDNKNIFYDKISLQNELEALMEKYNIALETIKDLTPPLKTTTQLDGIVNIEAKNMKPFIYTTALINIYQAWYLYLYDTMRFEPKMIGVIDYVDSLKEHAYTALIEKLDRKYGFTTHGSENVTPNYGTIKF